MHDRHAHRLRARRPAVSPLKHSILPARDISPGSASDMGDDAASAATHVGLKGAADALTHSEQARTTEWSFCKAVRLDEEIVRNIDALASDAAGVRQRRRKSLAHWRLRAGELEMERQLMAASLPERMAPSIGKINLPLLTEILAAVGHDDGRLEELGA